MTTIITWGKTKNDTRDTASSTLAFDLLKGSATSAARELDRLGQLAADRLIADGVIKAASHNGEGVRVASGHGVTIKYDSGKTRNVRGV